MTLKHWMMKMNRLLKQYFNDFNKKVELYRQNIYDDHDLNVELIELKEKLYNDLKKLYK